MNSSQNTGKEKACSKRRRFSFFILLLLFSFLCGAVSEKEFHLSNTWILQRRIDSFVKKRGEAGVVVLDGLSGDSIYIYNERCVRERGFPPGSLAKVFAAAVLHMQGCSGIVYTCRGRYYPPRGRLTPLDPQVFNLPRDKKKRMYFRCSLRRGHGECDLQRALVKSCNTWFLSAAGRDPELADEVAAFWGLDACAKRWHEQSPGGKRGVVTSFRKQASVIGEGGLLLLSPLQVARLYRRLLTSPHEKGRKIPVETQQFLRRCLSGVVQEGTLKKLVTRNSTIDVTGGKTGTATFAGERYRTHGWNVIFFTMKKRTFLMVTFVMRGSGGGAARELSAIVLDNLAVGRIN